MTINAIEGAGGVYIVGIKANQARLYRYCICRSVVSSDTYKRSDKAQRGHGRVEQRSYACFTITPTALAPRWQDAGLATLIRVVRNRQGLRGETPTQAVSNFISNNQPSSQQEADGLFEAIREHWRIEAMHYRRAVKLCEDGLRTGSQAISRLMSNLRTLVMSFLRRIKPKNKVAQLENFADNFPTLLQFMTQEMVL